MGSIGLVCLKSRSHVMIKVYDCSDVAVKSSILGKHASCQGPACLHDKVCWDIVW